MTHTISKDFHFSASHQLEGVPEGHPCARAHWHAYTVRAALTGAPTKVGLVVDVRVLDGFNDYLTETLGGQHLNAVLDFNPTAEHMAEELTRFLAAYLANHQNVEVVAVSVSETPETWAKFTQVMATYDPHEIDTDRYRDYGGPEYAERARQSVS